MDEDHCNWCPEIMHEALETGEARSYIAAREAADAERAGFRRKLDERCQEIVRQINEGTLGHSLPEGMRFAWE